jgi:hypothetical protein
MRDALPDIPVVVTGPDFPMATLMAERRRLDALLDAATRHVPATALRQLDKVSRQWLVRWNSPRLGEIDAIAAVVGRPGTYFFSVNYEWGCTSAAKPAPDCASARLIRVLDWRTPGLGRNVIAADVAGPAGRYVTLTWPGYTGVLTAMAPKRFSAALNQAPMRKPYGVFVLDWAQNRARVWTMPHPMPGHLLRQVFDEARTFAEARSQLITTPICSPAIFTLAGLKPSETVVIERTETEARVHDGANVAANHWQAAGWHGRPRGHDSAGRACQMHAVPAAFDAEFAWLRPPVLNGFTRLAAVADAAQGRLMAQGWEADGPATRPLDLTLDGGISPEVAPHAMEAG